jgi:AhpC/TSA family.
MGKFFKIIILFVAITAFSIHLRAQGYEIKIKISALKDSSILLGHHFANSLYPDDTIKLDKKGMGVFKGKKPLPGGMYIVFLPSKKYFDIMVGDNQVFTITADTGNFLKTVKFTGSLENQLFFDYQNLIADKRDIANKLAEQKKRSTSTEQKDSITKALEKINQEVVGYTKKIIADNPKLFFITFLKALQEVEVPEPPRDAKGKITDSTFQYKYYRKHYFDNFNYADPRLLRTPIYEEKIKNYIEKVVPQIPDTLITEVDAMLDKVKSNEELFRYLLVTLFNEYATSQIMGMDAVFVHIAEKYYIPNATWSSKDYMDKLKKEIAKKKPNLLGKIAPNLNLVEVPTDHFLIAKTDTALKSNPYVGTPIDIYGIKAKFLVIAFWEADCGHCKKAIPLLYDSIYPRIKELGAKVLAIHMIASVEGKRKWIDFVNEHNMYDWINAWSPYSYEYKDLYDVYSTPVIYVLDENKRIVAKRIGPEQIEDVIKFELRKEASPVGSK